MQITSWYQAIGLALLAACISPLNAWDKLKLDVLQENAPLAKGDADHLTPSEHIFPRDYYLIQFVELKQYVESDWLLRITLNSNKTGANIHLFEDIPNLKYNMRHYTDMADHKSTSTRISLELAESIYRVWTNVLFETRYSKSDIGNFEGKIAQFSTYIRGTGWLVGEAQTGYHTDAPPKRLIEISYLLKTFLNSNDEQRALLTDSINKHILWIYKYLEEYGKN